MAPKIENMTVSEYCDKYVIARNAVHRRIRKVEETGEPLNNIVGVNRFGKRTIILLVNTKKQFTKR